MWNRFYGQSNDSKDGSHSQNSWYNDDEQRRLAQSSTSTASSTPKKRVSSVNDGRGSRGYNRSSTNTSATIQGQHPAVSASTVSRYESVPENKYGESYMAPILVSDVSNEDQMPRSGMSRSSRDQDQSREVRDKRRGKQERSDGRDQDAERRKEKTKRDTKDKDLKKSGKELDKDFGTSRGPGDFPDQVASSGFSQFPGQYDGAISGSNGAAHGHPAMSSHVQDQFPGQFPTQSSAPYRPPLAANEGGPGLAAEYYGDAGQSVAEQPGNRVGTPSLIIGAEPHLQPALAVAAPPPEPSASGAVGAAASFFSGDFEEDEVVSTHGQQTPSTYYTGHTSPYNTHHSSSASVIPTVGASVIGSATGYLIGSQASSHQQPSNHNPSTVGVLNASNTTHRPPSEAQDSYQSSTSQPPKPGKPSSQSSSIPMYAAGVAGAAGLAAAAYEHNHHTSTQEFPSTSQYPTISVAHRRHNHGPLSSLINFFKDPEGVAQFEEYSQITGVCRHCFAPGSSPRDAPRKHFYGRRRSFERYGNTARVDKDSRYHSSENEGRRKNKSWLATGLAGYGLAKVGENLFKGNDERDEIYGVKRRRSSPDRRDYQARRGSRFKEHIETRVTDDGNSVRNDQRDDTFNSTTMTRQRTSRPPRTRSTSADRNVGLNEAIAGAAPESFLVTSSSRRQSPSLRRSSSKSKQESQGSLSERRHGNKKKKRDKGFFSFGIGSSSSSSIDSAYSDSQKKHRRSKSSTGKSKDDKKAEAALLGLGAAAAALALNDSRQGHKKKGVRELVGVKESKIHDGHESARARVGMKTSTNQDEELWESAAEDDYESMDSDLAYGASIRSDSQASLSSESSGTNKWGWRWGSKKKRRVSPPREKSEYAGFPAKTSAEGADSSGPASASLDQRHGSVVTSTSSLPLQHVHPVPTSDPSRFDVGLEEQVFFSDRPAMSTRPDAVPLQHPRPVAPISAAIYSSRTVNSHSNSAPAGAAAFSHNLYHYTGTSDARHDTNEVSKTGNLPHFEQQADNAAHNFKIRRRDTSPARYGADSISSSMASQKRTSTRDDSSTVRFDLTEEQEERERQERRRKRKLDKDRREAEEHQKTEKKDRVAKEFTIEKRGSKTRSEGNHATHENSWVGPAAIGIIGAAVGSAATTERSDFEETREQRRERRRREREIEDEEDAFNKSQRRRRQREHDDQVAATQERGRLPDEMSASTEYPNYHWRPSKKQEMSVWQEAASTKRISSHENYGAFFTPLELLNKSSDQVKTTSANADADVDLEQVPQIVTVEPKRIHDLSDSPTSLLADIDDKGDSSKMSFPWQVPKLRLVEPTPPSTRGSTPVLRAEDGDKAVEEPWKDRSSPKVKWSDDQTPEYTIITPKEESGEIIETHSMEVGSTDAVDSSKRTHDRDSPDDKLPSRNDSKIENSSASYGEDIEFAATLAASAEDAGFDPSIVIDNPRYRRRDSPPGSNEHSMPGGFDDENELRFEKRERKTKGKKSGPQSQNNGANLRDDGAIVQDIISQVQKSESLPLDQSSSETFDDEWQSRQEIERAKAEKERKGSESGDKLFKMSETAPEALRSEKRDVDESSIEDVRSIASINSETESDGMSHKDSIGDSAGFDKAGSALSSSPTTEVSKDSTSKPNTKRKDSIWSRVLGRSVKSLPQEIGAKDATEGATKESHEKFEKEFEKHEGREPDRDTDDDHDHDSQERNSIENATAQIRDGDLPDLPIEVCNTGLKRSCIVPKRLTSPQLQESNVPSRFSNAGSVAKYLDHSVEMEQNEEKLPESFLGMGPEPPPPPDKRAENGVVSTPSETASIPASSHAKSTIQSRRSSDAEVSGSTQVMAVLPSSPTAVPFHFRRPGHSSSIPRSLSQTSFNSNKSAADLSPKQRTRPRSTEFKSSTEIRPLWLVERHRSFQEPTHEVYPSLPSSHTTSRSSSIHDPEERDYHQKSNYEADELELKPIEAESTLIGSTDGHFSQSNSLDSQQANLIGSSLQDSRFVHDLPCPQDSKISTTSENIEGNVDKSSCTAKSAILGAISGDTAAVPLHKDDPLRQDLSGEGNDDFGLDIDDEVPSPMTHRGANDALNQDNELSLQKAKKNKKNKRKANPSRQEILQASDAAEARQSEKAGGSEPLSLERMQQMQEQDTKDAVDSWSPSVRPSTRGKKAKKGKGKALIEKSLEENELPRSLYESPSDAFETAVSAEGQEKEVLTPDMSRRQIVDVMTATAQDVDNEADDGLQSAMLAEENRSEPKVEKDSKDQKIIAEDESPQSSDPKVGLQDVPLPLDDLPPDDFHTRKFSRDDFPQERVPQDNLQDNNSAQDGSAKEFLPRNDVPQDRHEHDEIQHLETQAKSHSESYIPVVNFQHNDSPQPQKSLNGSLQRNEQLDSVPSSNPVTITFEHPFSQDPASLSKSPKVDPTSQDFNRGEVTAKIHPQVELSPRATPLPDGDDDYDLLDEPSMTPTPPSLGYTEAHGRETTAEGPRNSPNTQDPSAIAPEPQGQSPNLLSQAERLVAGGHTAVSSASNSNEVHQSLSAEDKEDTGIQIRDGLIPTVAASETMKEISPKGLNEEPRVEVPIERYKAIDDELAAFSSRENGDTEKKAKERLSALSSESNEFPSGQRSPLHTKIEKSDSQVMYPMHDLDDAGRQVKLQSDAKHDIKDITLPLASTQPSQEASAMSGVGEPETSLVGGSKETLPSDAPKDYNSHKSSESLLSIGGDQNLLLPDEPQIAQIEDDPAKARDDEHFPVLKTSVAHPNAAQVVQDILAAENDAELAADSPNQAKVILKETEEKINDTSINEDELDWNTSKRQKKSRKGKKDEAISLDRPNMIDPAEYSNPRAVNNSHLEQDSAAHKEKEDDVDLDSPKKRKKGKKGKKNEDLSLHESEIISSRPAALKSSLMEQEPAANTNDEIFAKQSKKNKGKKGKRRGLLRAASDLRDEDDPKAIPLEDSQDEDNAKDLPVIVSDHQEENNPGVTVDNVAQDDGKPDDLPLTDSNFRERQEPTIVPAKILHSDDQSNDLPAVDRPSFTSDMSKEVEPDPIHTEATPDYDKTENRVTDGISPDGMEGDAPRYTSERAKPVESDRDDKTGESREAAPKQEQQITSLKNKKDKRKSKKSKKSTGFSLDDGDIGDGQTTENGSFGKSEQTETIPSSVDLGEKSTKTVPEIPEQKEDFTVSRKKNKKKSKKFNAFPLDEDVLPGLEDEPRSMYPGMDSPEQTHSSSVEATEKAGKIVEDSPEMKDRESEGQRSEIVGKDSPGQSPAETAQELNKDSKYPNQINISNVFDHLGTKGGKREEAILEESDSLLVHAARQGISSNPISPVKSFSEKQAGAPEEKKTYNADEVQDNVNPAGATDMDAVTNREPIKKDEKVAEEERQLTEEDRVSQESRAIPFESGISENASESSTVPPVQHRESSPKPATPSHDVESAEIVQPEVKSEEDESHEESIAVELPSQERQDTQPSIEADQTDSLANVKIGELGATSNKELPEPEDHQSLLDTSPVHGDDSTLEKQPKDHISPARMVPSNQKDTAERPEKEEDPVLIEPNAIDKAKDEDLLTKMPVQPVENHERGHDEAKLLQPEVEELPAFLAPGPAQDAAEPFQQMGPINSVEPLESLDKGEPIPTSESAILDRQEQHKYDEEHTKEFYRANPDAEPITELKPHGDTVGNELTAAMEFQMLDAQEQREYNEEYTKELERQLSPLQEREQADSHDKTSTDVFPPLNINSVVERPYGEEHKPLAQPPALEDIIEEPGLGPSSVQDTRAEGGEEPSSTKSNSKGKKSKKGKKGKSGKRQQPIIWEDETATPPLEQDKDKEADPDITIPDGSALRINDAPRPLVQKEPVEEQSFEDRAISLPSEDFNAADTSGHDRDRSGDYLSIEPSKPAEQDMGRDGTRNSDRALGTELLDTGKGHSPMQELQSDLDDKPRNAAVKAQTPDEKFDYLAGDFHPDTIMETEPAKNQVEDDSHLVFVEDTEQGAEAKKRSSMSESNPKVFKQEIREQPPELEHQTADAVDEISPSRQQIPHSNLHEDEPPSRAEARPPSPGEPRGREKVSPTVVQGVYALAAESVSREDSNMEGSRGRKAEKAGSWTNLKAETSKPESSPDTVDQGVMAAREELRQRPDSENVKRVWQHHQGTPPQSPSPANCRAGEDQSAVENLGKTSETPAYRDSAVYVSGSPMASEETPFHRAVRDSGYSDVEASPTIDDKLENPDASTESKTLVAADEGAGQFQPQPNLDHGTNETSSSTPRNPLRISIEASSDYDVSISKPKERRKRSRGRSSAAYDSDDSADSGFDIQRRRRRQAVAVEPREPSPVSSTTKDRSSALFDSSPSAREEVSVKSQDQNMSPHHGPIREEPTWSFDPEGSSLKQSEARSREGRSGDIPKGDLESTDYSLPTGHRAATEISLFGGPRSFEDDVLSPSRSPRSSESRGRRRLNTISEDSADGSRLHGKDKRAVSDVGSPESGVKGRRMRSPSIEDDVAGEHRSAYDPIPHAAWPAIDEGKHAKDERSRSRNSDQLSALSSNRSTRPGMTFGHREGEYRTASAASTRSEKSIHAIIQTPDQVRSASGLSYYSSATPPLQRAHRSASGDLRGDSRKDEAKSRAKSNSEIDAALVGIPSSSTYDPVTDKGKTRADMADIYVSD